MAATVHFDYKQLELLSLILIWYCCTAFASIETKRLASAGGNILEFTFMSFFVAVPLFVLSEMYKRKEIQDMVSVTTEENSLLVSSSDFRASLTSQSIIHSVRKICKQDLAVALLQAGHVHFTNISIGLVDIKFAYMVQVVEPLLTLLFQHLMNSTKPLLLHIMTLVPVPVGIYLSTATGLSTATPNTSAHANMPTALFCAFISVATISARNVFFKGSKSGVVSTALPTSIWDSSKAYWRVASVAAICLFPGYIYSIFNYNSFIFGHGATSEKFFILVRGVVLHVIYNTFSFITLNRMQPVTHSLLNVIKRILTVTISMLYFKAALIPIQLFGILLANIGVASYGVVNYLQPTFKVEGVRGNQGQIKLFIIIASFVLIYFTVFHHVS